MPLWRYHSLPPLLSHLDHLIMARSQAPFLLLFFPHILIIPPISLFLLPILIPLISHTFCPHLPLILLFPIPDVPQPSSTHPSFKPFPTFFVLHPSPPQLSLFPMVMSFTLPLGDTSLSPLVLLFFAMSTHHTASLIPSLVLPPSFVLAVVLPLQHIRCFLLSILTRSFSHWNQISL